MKTYVDGTVASGFEEVRAEFERNIAQRGERTPEGDEPWQQDTMVVVMSTIKGASGIAIQPPKHEPPCDTGKERGREDAKFGLIDEQSG